MLKKIIFFFLTLFSVLGSSQKNDTSLYQFGQAEKELMSIQKKAFHSRSEKDRIEGNKEFIGIWNKIIIYPSILNYPFDSLKNDISVLSPKDKKFKLITWNLHKEDGTHAFFGYLLVNNTKRIKKGFMKHETIESYDYFQLIDRSPTVKYPETFVGSPQKWFGMLYVQLIECDGYYTLIGWDGNDKLTQRKFVDVLSFRNNGDAVFGKDVFRIPRKNPRRLMFEFSQEVSMSLKYDEKRNQIIYSHLSSKQEGSLLDGQYQYYGPDGSFDALEVKKGKWIIVEDIDIKSDIRPLNENKKPNPKKQTPVYKPK
ncbi:hypothetical protein [Aurantibacillus circumpalustris]|uniref:hypothetical protein n=1 Tax=Aurantibacillus circumpalustris TaxID=3036359 RepID=UPI00295A8DF0|nr:hypothetical protein [Aurantibacillus circumpalustris]